MDILKYKTIVIKIGSSLIVDGKNRIKKNWFNKLIDDINFLIQKNKQIIIVSSGAIALGCDLLKINKKNTKLSQFQAIAAIGQMVLGVTTPRKDQIYRRKSDKEKPKFFSKKIKKKVYDISVEKKINVKNLLRAI